MQARLELAQTFGPLLTAVEKTPDEANLLALGDAYWVRQERAKAVDHYFRLLSEENTHNALALSRVGQQLFFGGRNEDAIAVLERAQELEPANLQTLLFLGNAHFALEQYGRAAGIWEGYVRAAGGPERAGRVPGLIADARERLRTGAPLPREKGAVRASTTALRNQP